MRSRPHAFGARRQAFEPYYKLWTSAIDFKHSEVKLRSSGPVFLESLSVPRRSGSLAWSSAWWPKKSRQSSKTSREALLWEVRESLGIDCPKWSEDVPQIRV